MFHPIRSTRATIKNIKAAFRLFIDTLAQNSLALDVLAADQKQIRLQLDVLIAATDYLARAKRQELDRQGAGHRVR